VDHLPEERIVAFIDILGFQELVNRMPSEPDIFQLIIQTFREITEDFDGIRSLTKKEGLKDEKSEKDEDKPNPFLYLEQTHFSDSIVISLPINNVNKDFYEFWLILTIRRMVSTLLLKGILTGGGIARGWCYHNGNIIVGKAMIDAYNLEKNVAHVPRIVVTDEIVSSNDAVYFKCDSDGIYFIDIFKSHSFFGTVDVDRTESNLRKLMNIIIDNTKSIKIDNYNILSKYRWLANQTYYAILAYNKMYRDEIETEELIKIM